jgi:predicted transcriptional regulator
VEITSHTQIFTMSNNLNFQTVIDCVEELSEEEQDMLFDLIKKRRIEKRRAEIALNATNTLNALKLGTAKRGIVADLKADLLDDNEE